MQTCLVIIDLYDEKIRKKNIDVGWFRDYF